jgi:hypothetical protein
VQRFSVLSKDADIATVVGRGGRIRTSAWGIKIGNRHLHPLKPWGFFLIKRIQVKAAEKIGTLLLGIDWLSYPNGALLW